MRKKPHYSKPSASAGRTASTSRSGSRDTCPDGLRQPLVVKVMTYQQYLDMFKGAPWPND